MDFISKSDFSTVGGQKSQAPADFDFNSFNAGSIQNQQSADQFFAPNGTKPAAANNNGVIDLMDIFGGAS